MSPTRAPQNLLLGPASLDIYVGRDLVLPGGGALNMAWHLREATNPWALLTRVGDDRPDAFRAFLDRHAIPHLPGSLVGPGASSSIDIVIQPDLQPHMDNFVEGVWADYRSTPAEEAAIAGASRLHLVLVEGAIRELERLAAADSLRHLAVSADFLGFRHYTVERFAQTMGAVEIGFVGWPGSLDDPVLAGLRDVTHRLGRLLVVTLGSRGVQVFDGRRATDGAKSPKLGGVGDHARSGGGRAGGGGPAGGDRFFDVTAIPVEGTTVGCGDAFVAAFLDAWVRTGGTHDRGGDLVAAVEAGKAAGAQATRWRRPLPDAVYGPDAAQALAAADLLAGSRAAS